MKYIISCICTVALAMMVSCTGMDETYKEFLEGGPNIYVARVDSAKVFDGRERVKITWLKQTDPRAKYAKIYWANKSDSVKVNLDPSKSTETVIEGLTEGSYVFDIVVFDDKGRSSMKAEAIGNVYGTEYEKWLYNRLVKTAKVTGQKLDVTFANAKDTVTYIGSEIFYNNISDIECKVFMDKRKSTITINDYKKPSFKYRSLYLPTPTAIDTFYSEFDIQQTP